jgi:hypothetical protein
MSRWIDNDRDTRIVMAQQTAEKLSVDVLSIEKDWWVSAVLMALFKMSCSDYLLFRGGTSLSKGWDLIKRFSEDIDIAIDKSFYKDVKSLSCAKCLNNNQIKNLRKANRDYILGEFKDELASILEDMKLPDVHVKTEDEIIKIEDADKQIDHDKDPVCLFVYYTPLYEGKNEYLQPVVKIEISALSTREPFESRRITSLISKYFPDEDSDIGVDINTASPAKTFLEKAFLLNEEFQRNNPRTRRMSRHLYDLEHLMDTEYGRAALADSTMYYEIVKHRERFYHVGYVDYSKNLPSEISCVPEGDLLEEFRKDFESMKSLMVFGDDLQFDYIIKRLKVLQNRFRKIK